MPSKFPPQLAIGTRSQNKHAHPGMPDAKQSHRSKQKIQDLCAWEAQQAEQEQARLINGLKIAAQIEDKQVEEDVQQCTSNHQSQGIMPFNLHL
jgi:hypothetical protein